MFSYRIKLHFILPGTHLAKGCAVVVYSARLKREGAAAAHQDFPLAVKMMFNYHADSNAFTILIAMHRYLRFGESGLSFSSSGKLFQ